MRSRLLMQPLLTGVAIGAALTLALWPRPCSAQAETNPSAPAPPLTDAGDSAEDTEVNGNDTGASEQPRSPSAPPEPDPSSPSAPGPNALPPAPDQPALNDASAPEDSVESAPVLSEEAPSTANDPAPKELVPRLDRPKKAPRESAPFAPAPTASTEPVVFGPPDRHDEMPAQMVARPLSLPRGTLQLEWALYGVFVDHAPTTAHMPSFTWGIHDRIEFGLTGPFRFDDGLNDWTALDPTPHLLITALDWEAIEWGIFGSVLIPGSNDTKPQITFALPLLVHASERWRFDANPRVEWSSEKGIGSHLGLWLGASYQATRALYLGVDAGPELGLGKRRDSGVDARLTVGATMQTRERALVDVEGAFFFENLGGGPPDHFSDGGGFTASIRFFPEMY